MPTNDIEVRTFLIFLFQPKRIDCFSIVFCGIDKWLHANHLPSMDSAMHCSSFTLVAFNLTGPNLYLKNKQPRKVDISNIWWTPLDKNIQARCLMLKQWSRKKVKSNFPAGATMVVSHFLGLAILLALATPSSFSQVFLKKQFVDLQL